MKFLFLGFVSAHVIISPDTSLNNEVQNIKSQVINSSSFQQNLNKAMPTFCGKVKKQASCKEYLGRVMFCFEYAAKKKSFEGLEGSEQQNKECEQIDKKMPTLSFFMRSFSFLSMDLKDGGLIPNLKSLRGSTGTIIPELVLLQKNVPKQVATNLAHEMSHDLENNFNKIAPFGKEDTAKELQDHASKTQDTLVDAVENAEVAEIKRAVFRALTRLRAATIKEFDTIARLETQAIDSYNDAHHYRGENPLSHMHEDEAPVETDKLKSFH